MTMRQDFHPDYDFLPAPAVGIEHETLAYVNPIALDMLEAEAPAEVLGRSVFDFVRPLDRPRVAYHLRKMATLDRPGPASEIRIRTCKGQVRAVSAVGHVTRRVEERTRALVVLMDITHNRLKSYLQETERNVVYLFENTTDIYYRIDAQGKILMASPAVERILGYSCEEVIGRDSAMFYADPSKRDLLIQQLVRDGKVSDYEMELRGKQGQRVFVSFSSHALKDEDGAYLAVEGVMRDITERKRLEERLRELASLDELTGTRNRRVFLEHATEALRRARRYKQAMTLMILDIDWFKRVNDRFGHLGGDTALREFAIAVKRQLRDIDLFGRLGGEEFGIVLERCAEKEAHEVGERIRACVEALCLRLDGEKPLRLSVSIGATILKPGDERIEALLDRADKALYQAKHQGRNRLVWYARQAENPPEE